MTALRSAAAHAALTTRRNRNDIHPRALCRPYNDRACRELRQTAAPDEDRRRKAGYIAQLCLADTAGPCRGRAYRRLTREGRRLLPYPAAGELHDFRYTPVFGGRSCARRLPFGRFERLRTCLRMPRASALEGLLRADGRVFFRGKAFGSAVKPRLLDTFSPLWYNALVQNTGVFFL